jgi:hypothetical protein
MKGPIDMIRRAPKRTALALLLTGAAVAGVALWPSFAGHRGPPQKDMAIDAATRKAVVDTLIADLDKYYVYPDKAKQFSAYLRSRQQSGAYDSATSAEKFADLLTSDLQSIGKDGHLEVRYGEDGFPELGKDGKPSAESQAQDLADEKRHNFGIESVGRLRCNIGYLDLHAFAEPERVKGRFAAAMTLLGDTRALIIDLRKNHGGEPETVALLASYLFDTRTHLNDIYYRETDSTTPMWTSDAVDGPRYGSARKVYLVTSNDTFSAGEDFSYALKNLKRATLVGETTGGGAHPGEPRRLAEHFAAFVPSGRSISPITHTDWEGVGVAPDIQASAKNALDVAHMQALKDALAVEKDPQVIDVLTECIDDLK